MLHRHLLCMASLRWQINYGDRQNNIYADRRRRPVGDLPADLVQLSAFDYVSHLHRLFGFNVCLSQRLWLASLAMGAKYGSGLMSFTALPGHSSGYNLSLQCYFRWKRAEIQSCFEKYQAISLRIMLQLILGSRSCVLLLRKIGRFCLKCKRIGFCLSCQRICVPSTDSFVLFRQT